MRPIKFRAWDLLENKMIQWDELTSGKHPYNYLSMLASDLGIVIWMQFTGLTDKNGKEIFEGDLMTLRNPDREWKQKYLEVYWDNNLNGFSMISADHLYQTPIMEEDYIVIGNIYENSELLKENL